MKIGQAYQSLFRLYPADYRAMFAVEMLHGFESAAHEHRQQGRMAFLRFLLAESMGLIGGAVAEWFAKLTTDRSVRGRRLPDLRMMRPPSVPQELWFAGACAGVAQTSQPQEILDAENRIAVLISRTVHAIANHDFPGARACCREEREVRENLQTLLQRQAELSKSPQVDDTNR
jgi:hypothetical protein